MKHQIEQFKRETGIDLVIKDGKPYFEGDLYLQGTSITTLPENLSLGGELDLRHTPITTLPENLAVGRSLYLQGTRITTLPENLSVGGYLDLRHTPITTLPENLTVGGNLDLEDTSITTLPKSLAVGGYLDLRGTSITTLPENLSVGGNLYLRGTRITTLPENLSVGGGLWLRGTPITTLPENLAVGGYVFTDGGRVKTQKTPPHTLQWKTANKHYIKADGIFSEVISHKGNVYRIRQIGGTETTYLVTDGNGKYAHGKTLDEARKDLIYKISNRDTSRYKGLTRDATLTFEEAIEAYRVITGACAVSTKAFVENDLPKPHKKEYTIQEIIQLTKGKYGAEHFENFFQS